jgi:heme-NO-binding protein
MDSTLCIRAVGGNIKKVFATDTSLIGRPIKEVFRLIRPDIHIEWDKVYHHFSLFKQHHFLLRFFLMVDTLSF